MDMLRAATDIAALRKVQERVLNLFEIQLQKGGVVCSISSARALCCESVIENIASCNRIFTEDFLQHAFYLSVLASRKELVLAS